MARAKTRLEQTRLTAAFDGIISRVALTAGGFVRENQTAFQLLDVSRLTTSVPLRPAVAEKLHRQTLEIKRRTLALGRRLPHIEEKAHLVRRFVDRLQAVLQGPAEDADGQGEE